MIKAIAVDDEPPALKIIENFCGKSNFIRLQKTFTKPAEAIDYILHHPLDLIFLDVQMPSMSGIQLYRSLPVKPMVVFTTAYSEFAVEGFNLDAIDYLVKPYSFERFMHAMNKVNDYMAYLNSVPGNQKRIFVSADSSLVKVMTEEILYVEALDDYIKFHLTEGRKPIVSRMTMKSVLEKLSPSDFIRIHRSYIVPVSRIRAVYKKTVDINGVELPIGQSYLADFIRRIGQ
jgi:DNA-binding LytR/AlgR family response regulator